MWCVCVCVACVCAQVMLTIWDVCLYVCALLQILWTFSIYLESVAIMPQLYMISKTGEAETITSHYLFALGLYRGLYIVNWLFRYYTEGFYDLIAIVAGCVQTALYCDFFYLYITKGNMLDQGSNWTRHLLHVIKVEVSA